MPLLDVNGFTMTHDPTIVKENGMYYRFQTGPGLPVFRSADLCRWEMIGKVFNTNPQWTAEQVPGSTDFWAPEIVRRENSWRIYYSVSTFGKNTSAIGLALLNTVDVSDKGLCVQDKGPVIQSSSKDNYNCIDPALCMDEDANDYLLFGSFWGGLHLVRLDENGFVGEGESPVVIATRRTDPNPIEGGFIFPHDHKYYLFASHDFCCRGTASSYHIVVGCAQKITGPYYDDVGVEMTEGGGTMLRNGLSFERWAGPGHNSVFHDDDGSDYIVYHAYDRQNGGRPSLMIEKIEWKDGWPCLEP